MLASFEKDFLQYILIAKLHAVCLRKSACGNKKTTQVSPYQSRTWVVLAMAWLRDSFFPEVIRRKGDHRQLICKVKPVCRTAERSQTSAMKTHRVILNRSVIDPVTISRAFSCNFFSDSYLPKP